MIQTWIKKTTEQCDANDGGKKEGKCRQGLNNNTKHLCKIDGVNFYYFMKASKIYFCEILQLKVHYQNKKLKKRTKKARFN